MTNPQTQWRSDMENAPRDCAVLTFGPLGVLILEWFEEEYTPDPKWEAEDKADGFPSYEPYSGWSNKFNDMEYSGSWAPTHWMPLPTPPGEEA